MTISLLIEVSRMSVLTNSAADIPETETGFSYGFPGLYEKNLFNFLFHSVMCASSHITLIWLKSGRERGVEGRTWCKFLGHCLACLNL